MGLVYSDVLPVNNVSVAQSDRLVLLWHRTDVVAGFVMDGSLEEVTAGWGGGHGGVFLEDFVEY
jgi:hypothetical protein